MLATLADAVPAGEEWLHEVKWDGYRAIVTIAGGEAELTSRNGNSLTARFESVARAVVQAVKTPDCVLDGEVCALDDQGRASFSAMQQGSGPLVLYLFDVLEVEGEPLVDLPLTERHKRLEALLDKRNRTVRLSETFDDGDALFEAAHGAAARGRRQQARGLPLRAGTAQPQLAQGEDAGPAGAHRRRLHERAGPARGRVRRRSCSRSTRAAASAGPATSARASTTPRSSGCSTG